MNASFETKNKRYFLKRKSIIRSNNQIKALYTQGFVCFKYPLRILYKPEVLSEHLVMFSVPKKNFPRAVDRNTIKRRLREFYRHIIIKYADSNIKFLISVNFVSKEIDDSLKLEKKLNLIFYKVFEQNINNPPFNHH